MRTIAVTGSASGIGAATRSQLEAEGHRVIGIDVRDAEVVADLGTASGRQDAIDAVTALAGDALDGVVTFAGVPGLTTTPGSTVVSVNYFGAVVVLDGLRSRLERGERPAALVIGSNSATCQPGVPREVVERCHAGDEPGARRLADDAGALGAYPATKLALARWARRHAPGAEWAGSGITLNVVAPGPVATPLLEATRDDPVIGPFVDAFPVPLGRHAAADEIAAFVTFMLGPDARFFCGSVLLVDGGTDASLRPDDFPTPMP